VDAQIGTARDLREADENVVRPGGEVADVHVGGADRRLDRDVASVDGEIAVVVGLEMEQIIAGFGDLEGAAQHQ
jgi:hypothetical protein